MNNFKKVLNQQGITQSELARAIGVTRQCVNRWMQGSNHPNIKHIKQISAYLKVSIKKLFFEEV